jgi:Polyketide cyclase / dehydrase and lipid transport
MRRIHVEASAVIGARPEEVYTILADYRNGHPQILPREHFRDLQVEAGGRGTGTILRFRVRIGAIERFYRMLVSEPEPGRVLVEADIESDLTTTFTVTPINNGHKANVQIATEWDAPHGFGGLIEQMLTPFMMRRIYNKELRQLAAVMHSKGNSKMKSL